MYSWVFDKVRLVYCVVEVVVLYMSNSNSYDRGYRTAAVPFTL